MVSVKGFHYQPAVSSAAVPQGMASTADQAANTLKEYVSHLRDPNSGTVKDGVLFLRANKDGSSQIRRDLALSFRSRSGQEFKRAGEEFKTLFKQAYQERMDPRQYAALERSLSTYLNARSGQMGTKSLVQFHAAFEQAANRYASLTAQARALPASVTADLVVGKSDNPLGRLNVLRAGAAVPADAPAQPAAQEVAASDAPALSRDQRAQRALAQAYGPESSQVSLLGAGANSQAFLVQSPNQDSSSVITVPAMTTALTQDSLGTGELAAATARAPMPHVAKPTSFLLRVTVEMDEQLSHRGGDRAVGIAGEQYETYEVPAENLRAFLQATDAQGSKVILSGVKMPAGPSTNVTQALQGQAIEPGAFMRLASGLYQGLHEMAAADLVHHDVKPDNVAFDPRSGQVMLIDTGATVQLDRATGQTNRVPQRTEKFMSPSIGLIPGPGEQLSEPHGVEADRYAFAMTLMCTLSPALMKNDQIPTQALREVLNHGATHAQGRMGAFMHGLDNPSGSSADKDLASVVARELRVAFERDPSARPLLEQALASGMTQGAESQKHWDAVADQLRAQGADLPQLPGNGPAAVQPHPLAAAAGEPMSMLAAGDPKREGRFVLPARLDQESDPFDDFEIRSGGSFYEKKA